MAAGGSEQRRCGLDGCLKPCEGVVKDVLEKQPAGFGHEAGAPNGYPEGLQTSPSVHDRQHRLPVAPVSGLSVGPSGVHAQSAGQHQGALLPSSLLQKPLDGVSYPQLQPLLALLSAAQQSKPGLLMRSSSCEVPTGSSRKLPHKRTPNVLYKTELCRTWSATGQCRYGSKCQFAHGFHDLRPVQRHPKYKTEVCRTFAATGSCTYGARCKFIHSQASDTDSDETEQQIIAPSKAHSVPANFGSPSSVTHAALLSALRSLLITSQGGSTPAPFNSTSRAPMYQNGSLLASMSDSGDSTPSNLLHTSQLGHQGYINGSKPFDAQYADDTDQSRLTQAAAVLKLLQRQTPALSPFSQALGRLGPVVPAESGSTSGAMNLLSPAPYRNFQNGGDVATPNQQDLWLLSAPSPNDVGKMPALAAENHHGGTQAFWS